MSDNSLAKTTFIDDDLKRLKEFVDAHGLRPAKVDNVDIELDRLIFRRHIIRALLARLEAETDAADLLQLHYESGVFDDLDEGDVALIVQALEARRKAAGK